MELLHAQIILIISMKVYSQLNVMNIQLAKYNDKSYFWQWTLGADINGQPTIRSESCHANIDDIDLDFHGGLSWIYNIFSGIVESVLKDKLNDDVSKYTLSVLYVGER